MEMVLSHRKFGFGRSLLSVSCFWSVFRACFLPWHCIAVNGDSGSMTTTKHRVSIRKHLLHLLLYGNVLRVVTLLGPITHQEFERLHRRTPALNHRKRYLSHRPRRHRTVPNAKIKHNSLSFYLIKVRFFQRGAREKGRKPEELFVTGTALEVEAETNEEKHRCVKNKRLK